MSMCGELENIEEEIKRVLYELNALKTKRRRLIRLMSGDES